MALGGERQTGRGTPVGHGPMPRGRMRWQAPLPCRACWRTVPYMEGLSRETLAVIGAATALAGLILRQGSRIDKRFEQIEERLTSVEKGNFADWRIARRARPLRPHEVRAVRRRRLNSPGARRPPCGHFPGRSSRCRAARAASRRTMPRGPGDRSGDHEARLSSPGFSPAPGCGRDGRGRAVGVARAAGGGAGPAGRGGGGDRHPVPRHLRLRRSQVRAGFQAFRLREPGRPEGRHVLVTRNRGLEDLRQPQSLHPQGRARAGAGPALRQPAGALRRRAGFLLRLRRRGAGISRGPAMGDLRHAPGGDLRRRASDHRRRRRVHLQRPAREGGIRPTRSPTRISNRSRRSAPTG